MNPKNTTKKLRGMQKIGALLMNLDKNAAAQVLKSFSEDEILAIGEAMRDISGMDIPKEEMARIYNDFQRQIQERTGVFRPRGDEVEAIFHSSLGPDRSEEVLNELNRRKVPASSYFKKLGSFPKEVLARVLSEEHPQTIALVLSHIDSARAAKVLNELEEDTRLDIITRIATLKSPSNELNLSIAVKLEEKAKKALKEDSPEEAHERLRTVADMLNQVDKDTEKSVLGKISETDEEMAEEIRDLMFTFDDLTLVDKRAMQKILSGINVQVLAMALKGAKEKVETFIMSNVSTRVKRLILDEKELMGPKSREEVEGAQKEIVGTVRALIESGEITINRASEEELLV
jgi:flagellar motor switch protein FliG